MEADRVTPRNTAPSRRLGQSATSDQPLPTVPDGLNLEQHIANTQLELESLAHLHVTTWLDNSW